MTHTVVGIFDDMNDARQAMDQLVKGGFVKEDVDISQGKVSQEVADAVSNDTDSDIGDSISGFFNHLFGEDKTRAKTYSSIAREASGILTVQADSKDRAEMAAKIMDSNNAIDIENRAAQYQQREATTGRTGVDGDTETIEVIEENLEVGKKTVQTGGVQVRSRIVEKPVEETLRLREEHIVVNRRPVNREISSADVDNLKEGNIEITERAEKAVVGKQARVVEEIEVGKTVSEHEETITDTVRKTEVEVDEVDTDVDVDKNVERR